MRSKSFGVLLATGFSVLALTAAPATAAPAAAGGGGVHTMDLKAHVNSTVFETKLYSEPTGTTFHRYLPSCANFTYDRIVNGRYHDTTEDGWVSTDKAGSGWC